MQMQPKVEKGISLVCNSNDVNRLKNDVGA